MQGQTEGLPADHVAVQNAMEYRMREDSLIALQHPVGEDIYVRDQQLFAAAYNGSGTLLPSFCRAYQSVCGRKVVAIHAAKGATIISQWLPETERYAKLIEKIRAGIRAANRMEKAEHVYLIWLQGESDAVAATSEDEYLHDLLMLKNAIKQDAGVEKFAIIQVGYFASVVSWASQPAQMRRENDEAIMRAQRRAAEQDDDFVLLTRICEKLSLDPAFLNPEAEGHYNNAAQDLIGSASGAALAKIAL